jgi:hypothetical protein
MWKGKSKCGKTTVTENFKGVRFIGATIIIVVGKYCTGEGLIEVALYKHDKKTEEI